MSEISSREKVWAARVLSISKRKEKTMRETFRILPVYTGDVSGVCSALYELGGMVVIHDPSGCNSTYNTHDEVRWYDRESLIFLTGLNQRDAVLGNDQKLIDDVVEAASVYHPAFIALCNSPIPWLSGTDFQGISRVIEKKTHIPTFQVPTNALHDYTVGGGAALRKLAEKILGEEVPSKKASSRIRINVLGMTPLDFTDLKTSAELKELLESEGFEVIANWAMGSSLLEIKESIKADVNLVVSALGLPLGRYLEEKFHIPYVTGMPIGEGGKELYSLLRKSARDGKIRHQGMAEEKSEGDAPDVLIIGEPVTSKAIAGEIKRSTKKKAAVLCPVEEGAEVLDAAAGDEAVWGEEEIESAIRKRAKEAAMRGEMLTVAADPLFEKICPKAGETEEDPLAVQFVPLPHLALSGRIYLKQIPSLLHMGNIL